MSQRITLSHGNGGKNMRRLIEDVFAKYLHNDLLNTDSDAALLPFTDERMMMTVDGFTVQPVIFPGGNIGSLCVHGTVNDLAVSGAVAKYLTLGVILEEGLKLSVLEEVVKTLAETAAECGVKIVCGDTKVVPRGQGSEIYFTTTGIGYKKSVNDYSTKNIRSGDKIITSGTLGDHGAAIMLAREQFGLSGHLVSDNASVLSLCEAVYGYIGVRFMRDPTRGGVATVLHEIALATGLGVKLLETGLPVREEVKVICDMLGYDALYLASEGRVIAVVDADVADKVVDCWKNIAGGEQACVIGEITNLYPQIVIETELGGERILPELSDDPLPRIC
jgi:hydrogenase expression/formation protein HypE